MQQQVPEWPWPQKPPREVQERALAKGWAKSGFAYFMRQRLGKTLLAYAEYTLLRERGDVDWMVVICPNSIKQQWLDAIEEVDPTIPVNIYNSQQKTKTYDWLDKIKNGGVLLINYESVKTFMANQGWQKLDTLRTYIVADESSKIKEHAAKMTKACLELSSICGYRRVLTGKPTANSNADIWGQLKFIGATDRNYYQHKFTYCIMGGYQGKTVKKNINLDQLKAEMDPYCYIAEDKYIQGFEKVYEPLRYVELTGKQLEMYEEMEDSLITEIESGINATAPIVLTKYLRLQQISSGIVGDIDGNQHNIVAPHHNPRIDNVIDIIENEIDHKVIIVCRFKLSIQNLYSVLTSKGYKVAIMQGGMGAELDRQKSLFTDSDYDILLAQIQVLSFGHTLCGPDDYPCTDMIFYENDFSLINRAQCESRPEKMERQKSISYWDMYASKMDKVIIEALIRKEDAAIALMGYSRKYGILNRGSKEAKESGLSKDQLDQFNIALGKATIASIEK